MSEFEDLLGKILGDPDEMEKIANLASQLMGGTAGGGKKTSGTSGMPGVAELSAALGKMSGSDSKTALVAALGPYLHPERRRKLEKALKISRLAGIAEIAVKGMGEDNV